MTGRGFYDANEVLAFLFELAALAVFAWWGFTRGAHVVVRLALGLGAPLAGAVLWGMLAAPRAVLQLPLPAVLAVKAAFFLTAALALAKVRNLTVAALLALLVAVNLTVATVVR
ncbi:YrdB family protein [Micromonospora lupini]|uniref:YrdB family protein n=1 Tax=Micromonospora lupini TaxID=285679 RepID=UPI0031D78F8A